MAHGSHGAPGHAAFVTSRIMARSARKKARADSKKAKAATKAAKPKKAVR